MSWLNFIILNGVAPINDLHLISDAGPGKGLMHLHPTRDTELIACGRANTLINGQQFPSPVLESGAMSPAILVHGVLLALQANGFNIRLHCYQLGLEQLPDFSGNKLDDIVIHQCPLGDEAALIENHLVPELTRQQQAGEQHLIAESGIGGTTFATLWLTRYFCQSFNFAGSTKESVKLKRKQAVISKLMQACDQVDAAQACYPSEPQPVTVKPNFSHYLQSQTLSDPIQRACCQLHQASLTKLCLAGGVMMLAPVIAMQQQSSIDSIEVATTRWIMQSPDMAFIVSSLPSNCCLNLPKVRFDQSRFAALHKYEQGHIVEGCGLGACLYFAEQQGITGQQLIDYLDSAVACWLS